MINRIAKLPLQIASLCAQRLSIVIYHRVLAKPDHVLPGVPSAAKFSLELAWLKNSFNVLPLEQAVCALLEGKLPPRSLCITFDDGYRDNLHVAVPILKDQQLSACFFITTAFMDGGMMWNDRVTEAVRQIPAGQSSIDLAEYGLKRYAIEADRSNTIGAILNDLKYHNFDEREAITLSIVEQFAPVQTPKLMMDASEILELSQAGMEIGGHTHRHPILKRLDTARAFDEIRTNKEMLEGVIGKPLLSFAYPNGRPNQDYDIGHTKMVEELGFKHAVSTAAGTASRASDVFQIPRFSPWDDSQLKYCLRMAHNYFRAPEVAD